RHNNLLLSFPTRRSSDLDQAVVIMAQANGKSNMKFQGWRRENGRVGVRNHVVILPLDDLSNAACEAVANNIKGTLAIPHAYGRLDRKSTRLNSSHVKISY